MAFTTCCTNRGCGKQMEPYIDPKTEKVFCSICNKEIINITYFAKAQLKSLKQFKPKVQTSFSVKCDKCGQEGRPKLIKDELFCCMCNVILSNLSLPFKNMLKEQLLKVDKDA